MKSETSHDSKSRKIHVLDNDTINQIAAGEVVERPASVVKELVENAIDAGAGYVRIDIVTGDEGITSIRVVDDGEGMSRDDAITAFTRHATSKIHDSRDLHSIHTLGFRGEALASIAAVSRVELISKPRGIGAVAGTEVILEGGGVLTVRERGAPEGTTISVRDLFFNTPARKKFLKSTSTELAHVFQVIERVALAHPDIAIKGIHNSRERIVTPGSGSLLDAITALYGPDIARELISIDRITPLVRISGFLAQPSINKPNPDMLAVSINDRHISSTPLMRAVREGYGTLIQRNRYPVAFLNLGIDTALVDVNVHPTKREVRLSREQDIARLVSGCISDTLRDRVRTPVPDTRSIISSSLPSAQKIEYGKNLHPGVKTPISTYSAGLKEFRASEARLRHTEERKEERSERSLPPMIVMGQVAATYILARTQGQDEELLIIDQHAAHERVLYEQVLERRERGIEAQELIVPVLLQLRPQEGALIRGALHTLMQEGFILEEFGTDTFAVRTIPVILGKQPDPELIRDIISDLIEGELQSTASNRENVTKIIACRGAIKAGTSLSIEQMNRLLDQLSRTDNPFTCPHGRPTIISLSQSKLDTLFKRG